MKDLSDGLPRIIYEKVSFSCFLGFVKGTIEVSVYDKGTSEFPLLGTVETNLGSGTISYTLKGNEIIKKSASGITIEVTISEWKCTPQVLSFHVKAVGKKGLFSCTVIDRTVKGDRHNKKSHEELIRATFLKLEALK